MSAHSRRRSFHLSPIALKNTFKESVELCEQTVHLLFEDYAMAHGYASTGTLFAQFFLSEKLEEVKVRHPHKSPTDRMRIAMQLLLCGSRVGNQRHIIFGSKFIGDARSFMDTCFLRVSKQISIDNDTTLEPGGILVASEYHATPAVQWPGMIKWFMADKSTLLFTCNAKGYRKPVLRLCEEVALHRGHLGVLYIPPPPQPSLIMQSEPVLPPLTFKRWLKTPDFISMTHQQPMDMWDVDECDVLPSPQKDLVDFARDYGSDYADMTPSLLSQEAADEYISLNIGSLNINLFDYTWDVWVKTHTAEMHAESAFFKKWVLGNRRTNYLHFHGPIRDMRTALQEMKMAFLNEFIQIVLMKRIVCIGEPTAKYIANLSTEHYW